MSQHGQILQKKGRLWISMNLNIQVAIFAKCFFIFCHLFQFRRWVFYPAFPVPLGSSLCHVERNIKNIFCMSVTSHDSQVQVSLPELCLISRCFQVFADLTVSKGMRTLKVQSCTSTSEAGVDVIGGSKETDDPPAGLGHWATWTDLQARLGECEAVPPTRCCRKWKGVEGAPLTTPSQFWELRLLRATQSTMFLGVAGFPATEALTPLNAKSPLLIPQPMVSIFYFLSLNQTTLRASYSICAFVSTFFHLV